MLVADIVASVIGIPKWLQGLIVAAALLGGAFWAGHHQAASACQAAQLQAKLDTLQRDMNAWKAADEIETMLDADREAERRQLEQEVADYEKAIAARPPDAKCSLTDDDLRGLNRVPVKRRK